MSGGTPERAGCRVLWSPLCDRAGTRALLDEGERARYEALRDPGDRARFVTGRALVRTVLGRATGTAPDRVRISRLCRHCGKEDGKPFVPGTDVRFSLSHSGEHVVLAVTRESEIGVDVQRVSRGEVGEIAGRVLSAEEHRQFETLPTGNRAYAFAVYWARKEALLKAVGVGIAVPKRAISVSAPGQPAALLAWRGEYGGDTFGLADLRAGSEYAAALAVRGGGPMHVTEHVIGDPLDAGRG